MTTEVPFASIEIPMPESLAEVQPLRSSAIVSPPAPERRSTDALIKEVSIPINLSLDEIREHRRLKLKITLDVNLLP